MGREVVRDIERQTDRQTQADRGKLVPKIPKRPKNGAAEATTKTTGKGQKWRNRD